LWVVRQFALPLLLVGILLGSAGSPANGEESAVRSDSPRPRQGPFEIRDDQVVAQPRLTLPATTPDTLGRGQNLFQTAMLWSNSFGWTQDVAGERPKDRRFLVDGETATMELLFVHGFRDDLDAGLRLPLQWRGGGALDGLIDAWHRILGLPDGDRPRFLKDAFRVEGVTTGREAFSWADESGFGLGNVEAFSRWRFHRGRAWTSSLIGRAVLPTGTGPFADNGAAAGLQLVGARSLGSKFDAYLGLGGTLQGGGPVHGVTYEPARASAFVAFEWRVFSRMSLLAESNIASRLVDDIDRYPGIHWLVNGGASIALSENARLDLGFTENFMDQMATTDFALYFALRVRPSSRRAPPPSSPASPR
jgi:hypothetical protein